MASSTTALLAAREQLRAHKQLQQPQQTAKKPLAVEQTKKNNSSLGYIEDLKELVDANSKKAARVAMVFDSLTSEEKALTLIAAGISPQLHTQSFNEFDQPERRKIINGVKLLDSVTRKFQEKVGVIKFLSDNAITN